VRERDGNDENLEEGKRTPQLHIFIEETKIPPGFSGEEYIPFKKGRGCYHQLLLL
jgi:hypothetical protein